jgi:hypothetical protein
MNNITNVSVVPTPSPTGQPEVVSTGIPTPSPTGQPEINSTGIPTPSPSFRQDDIDVIRLPDYTQPESIDGVFIIMPLIFILVITMICCQRKARLYDNR